MREYYHKNKDKLNEYSRQRYAMTKQKLAEADKLLAERENTQEDNDEKYD